MSNQHPVLAPVALITYTTSDSLTDYENHPKRDVIGKNAITLTGNLIGSIQKCNKTYNAVAYNSAEAESLPDFVSYMMTTSVDIKEYLMASDFLIIPTIAFKEAYRSLKVHEYKNITCLELGTVTGSFKGNTFDWSAFICVKNKLLDSLDTPEIDYSTYNINPEMCDIKYFRPLVKQLAPIYGALAIPLLLYIFRFYNAVSTKNTSPILFNLPDGLDFLNDFSAKHVHKNEKMTNYLQNMMEILALAGILVP